MITSTHYVVRTETRPGVRIIETVYRSKNPEVAAEECRRRRQHDPSPRARYQLLASPTPPPFATRRYVFTQ